MIKLYSNNQSKKIDTLAANHLGVNSFELMQLAGQAIYTHVKDYRNILVVTGSGNNGGDGFIVAELARQNDKQVKVLALRPIDELSDDAKLAADLFQGEVLEIADLKTIEFSSNAVIVDAILGTGISSTVKQPFADVINWINSHAAPVISVDIPSGLNGSTGQILGSAIKANKTISILTYHAGLFTADGKDCCGEVMLEDMSVPQSVYAELEVSAELLHHSQLNQIQQSRTHNSHKGSFGHVIAAGGQPGMLGAVLLAAHAVLKTGAGSVTALTHPEHANLIPLYAAEIMSQAYEDNCASDILWQLTQQKQPEVVVLGMGLGKSAWSKRLFKSCVQADVPLVMDADGLNLLAQSAKASAQLKVITPHPKEAAVLLGIAVSEVQADRFKTVQKLAHNYRCVVVLKGAGTLISDGNETFCCPYGSSDLATAGTGDVLAGMIAGLMAQQFEPITAAQLAVIWHAWVGEHSEFNISLTATDLLNSLHQVWQQL